MTLSKGYGDETYTSLPKHCINKPIIVYMDERCLCFIPVASTSQHCHCASRLLWRLIIPALHHASQCLRSHGIVKMLPILVTVHSSLLLLLHRRLMSFGSLSFAVNDNLISIATRPLLKGVLTPIPKPSSLPARRVFSETSDRIIASPAVDATAIRTLRVILSPDIVSVYDSQH